MQRVVLSSRPGRKLLTTEGELFSGVLCCTHVANVYSNYSFIHKGTEGVPVPDNFRVEETTLAPDLKDGEVLVRTLCLSVDPYMVTVL